MLLVGLVVAALLIRRLLAQGFDASRFLHLAAAADARWLASAWACAVASYALRALRWRLMIIRLRPGGRFRDVLAATFIGYTATVALGRAMEFLRPVLIARGAGLSISSQFATWMIERIYDTLLLFALFGYALLVSVQPEPGSMGPLASFVWRTGGWLAALTCSLCLIVLIGLHFYSGRLEESIAHLERSWADTPLCAASRFLRRALEGIHSVRGAASVAGLFILSVAEWMLVACIYLSVFRAFPETARLRFADACVFTGMTGIGSFVQIPGIGGGVQIAAIAALTEFFHVGVEQAGLIALAAWITAFVGIVPFGLIAALTRGLSWTRLVRLGREQSEETP